MNIVDVHTTGKSYPVLIGQTIMDELLVSLDDSSYDPFLIIDQKVSSLYHERLRSGLLGEMAPTKIIEIPSGETSKSISMLSQVYDFLLHGGIRRNSIIIVVGGGVTGDIGGFAAATVLRGVPFIQVPTTLLAMVDSAVGGKTGINHSAGKNLIGAFYQPEKVLVDVDFLTTLPQAEWNSGLGEIIKYAAIQEPALFPTIYQAIEDTSATQLNEWIPIIAACIRIKADIVQQDEKEANIRAWLNFGHTFAHALETALAFQHLRHGEAVYLGMIAAVFLSKQYGASIQLEPLLMFNRHLQLRWPEKAMDFDYLIQLMGKDKKNRDQGLTFILLEQWGKPYKKTLHAFEEVKKAMQLTCDALR